MKIINLGILAHVDAGKTTVTEGLLVHSGAKARMGRVDDGTTTTDSMSLERQRGMTIRAATVSFLWRGTKINLIDTPGHMDFFAEVERSLRVLDGVILVISAREGVQPQTRVIFEKLRLMKIPTLIFVNKVDRMGVSLDQTYGQIAKKLTPRFLPMQVAAGVGSRDVKIQEKILCAGPEWETLIETDDDLMRAYLEGELIPEEALRHALRQATLGGQLFPLYLGAALHDVGIGPLLDAVEELFGRESMGAEEPLCAYIYKVEWGAYDHKWAYLRVFSGTLRMRERVSHCGREEPVHVRGLLGARDGGFGPVDAIHAGDIGVLLDAPFVRCGDFLGMERNLPGTGRVAEPLLSISVEPPQSVARSALLDALQRLTEEDPVLQLSIHPQTEEISLRLFGVLQREILQTLLMERFGIDAAFSPVQTLYKEQPLRAARAEIRIFTPGNFHQAGIALEIEPLPTGSGTEYVRRVSYGDLVKTFQNAVEEGVRAGLLEGLGYEIIDCRVTFYEMDYSSVTSTPADYRRLAPLVLQKALKESGLSRLEPWLRFEISAPLEFQKKVLAAVNRFRGTMASVLYEEEEFRILGEAPLDTTKEFASELLSMTQGQGMFDTEFLEYRRREGEPGAN